MLRARFAYFRVLRVSSALISENKKIPIITVLLLPPNQTCNSRVSLLSRYGTCTPSFRFFSSPSALITFPRARSPLLM
nr:hypothetical protein AX774_g1302 [Ipomoea batatas]